MLMKFVDDSKENVPKRSESLIVGIKGDDMHQAQVQIPTEEPPPLPENDRLKAIGKRATRWDGNLKVSGSGKYTADIRLPGMLYAQMVDATVPHAKVVSIDTTEAEKMPGVKAVHVVEHVLGNAQLRDPKQELPSKYPIVRYAGQPVAAVAAVSPQLARAAALKVKVKYAPLPFVVDRDDARKHDAPLVYPGPADQAGTAGGGGGPKNVPQVGNVHGPAEHKVGYIDEGFSDAAEVVEARYITQVQTHSALETHGVVADWKPDVLTVYASTQGTSTVRDELAYVFSLPKNKVRVITEYMGGGFGAKFGAGNFGVVATHLSKKAGAPVWLMLDRQQEHLSVGNRPDSDQSLKIGAKKDGTLSAIQLVSYGTAGCGTGAGCSGPAINMYKCPNVHTQEYDVFINGGPAASFRAPGHPQGCFALEQSIDELAEKLGMDPLDFRDKNDEFEPRRVERRIGREKFGWDQRRKAGSDPGPVKRGMGVAQAVWYRIIHMDSAAEVRVHQDGSVELMSGVQDIGGGIKTVLAQVVAEEFGLTPKDISIRIGDTQYPSGPPSGGSCTTASITPAARNAAYQAKLAFLRSVAPALNVSSDDLVLQDGHVRSKSDSSKSWTFKRAAAKMRTSEIAARADRVPDYKNVGRRLNYGGVHFIEISVDTEMGHIHVERALAVQDCGRPMNPLHLESQINGGVLQGISYALYENRILDKQKGLMVNPNFDFYKVIGAQETPKIEIHVIENYLGLSSTDAGGIGEPSTMATAAAIANAFYNATGVRMRRTPMTPAAVLETLGKVRSVTA
ncbi:MAG TPA: xanthine dehydrogenase family protein molybdopterin-binding subunit [Bryobacteraceae bacterium]|nr:xanthine dehydrogenase family protein molybdopterin-binding subunit [Bryobacteraceae bacterium]